jgi:hypothetical protein
MPTAILVVCFIRFYNFLKPCCIDQFNCYITSANALNLEALKLRSFYRKKKETCYTLFLGCLTKMLRLSMPVCRQSVERLWKRPVIIASPSQAEELLLKLRKTAKMSAQVTKNSDFVIPQLNILLPQASYSIVTRLRTIRSEKAGSIAIGGKKLSSLRLHPDRL